MAQGMKRDLEAEGDHCLRPILRQRRDVEVGGSWRETIVYALLNCKIVLLVLSDHSLASAEVAKEISLAKKYRKQILPAKNWSNNEDRSTGL